MAWTPRNKFEALAAFLVTTAALSSKGYNRAQSHRIAELMTQYTEGSLKNQGSSTKLYTDIITSKSRPSYLPSTKDPRADQILQANGQKAANYIVEHGDNSDILITVAFLYVSIFPEVDESDPNLTADLSLWFNACGAIGVSQQDAIQIVRRFP